ncbi:DUF4270 family protein [Pedobacter sp. MW01-1-1]|uniref:DUF4270 family protein n=1 Tax=Pedobacter sp. MW01-1-1 TaxID=3383027 RepID=UPI003FEDD9C7
MKFIKQDLLTLLIGLFLFASCKDDVGNIGLDPDGNAQIQGTMVNSPVTSQTIRETDVNTYNMSRYPLGYMVDPEFGTTQSNIALTPVPSTLSIDFTSAVLDSAVLVLGIDSVSSQVNFYGDTTNSVYNIDVFQLKNRITKYKSADVQEANTTRLGNFRSRIFPNTPIRITDVVAGKVDTMRTVKSQIRIPLDKATMQSLILNQPPTTFVTNATFAEYFKGLKAVATLASGNPGGIVYVSLTGARSSIELTYKKPNATTATNTDTLRVNFPISIASSPHTANVIHNYAGTEIEKQLNGTSTRNITATQGLVGVRTKISFPELTNFNTAYGKSIINRAELVVNLSAGTYAYPYLPASRLALYRLDIAEQPRNVPDHNLATSIATGDFRALSDAVFGGYYDSVNNRYVFVVTSYVQDLIDGKLTDYGTFIGPADLLSSDVASYPITTLSTAERSLIGKAANANTIKLNIFYTKIN